MTLVAGSRIGSYEVLAPIGAGGMGEVYRARDLRLNRDVALKVLPDVFSGDADRRGRFEREAQLLATLNHPHIAHIYGIEESAAGIHALVMELVDGPTLADRIAAGPVPVDEALGIARQIAEALENAHSKGVVHRDLKPANVKLTSDGIVKVLDFGLAKLIEPVGASGGAAASASPLTLSPTLSVQATYAGVLLGTAAYMSPEQARGRVVDHRADVWAFGCVLYEMLTATRPFEGEDLAETIGAVIHKQIDWTRLPANTPLPVRMTLERSLEKDPKRRIRDIGDVQLALSGAFETPAATVATPPTHRASSRAWIMAAVALAVGAVAAGGAVWALTREAAPQPVRFVITPPAGQPIAGTNTDRQLAMSPDGRRVVYIAGSGTAGGPLILRPIDSFNAEPLPGAAQARHPFFAPDGQSIGFFTNANGELKKISVNGGPAIELCRFLGAPRGASWGTNDTIVFATSDPSTGLLAVSGAGGEPKVLTKPDGTKELDHIYPSVLPGGKAVLFTINRGQADAEDVAVLELATGRQKILLRGTDATYVAPGYLVYAAAGTLRAVRFDLDTLAISGEAVPVVDKLAIVNAGAGQYATSQSGSLAYLAGTAGAFFSGVAGRNLVWVDRRGREEAIPWEPHGFTYPRLSPDDSKIAVNLLDQEQDVWVWDVRRRIPQRITFDPGVDFAPVWTPDGRFLLYAAARGGVPNIYRRAADGTGSEERLTTNPTVQWPTSITADGKTVIVHQEGAGTGADVFQLLLDGASGAKRQSQMLVQSNAVDDSATLSPDGRFIAYYSNRSGTNEVFVQPYPKLDGLWQVSKGGGSRPVWSKNGTELFYLGPTTSMMSVPVRTSPNFDYGNATKLFDGPWYVGQSGGTFDVAKDGRFLMIKETSSTQAAAPSTTINVVLNWTEELKRRLPR